MAAAMRLTDVYLAHVATQERRELAKIKAATVKAEPIAPAATEPANTRPQSPEDAEKAAREFLDRLHKEEMTTNEQ